jgi:hypothetical protein
MYLTLAGQGRALRAHIHFLRFAPAPDPSDALRALQPIAFTLRAGHTPTHSLALQAQSTAPLPAVCHLDKLITGSITCDMRLANITLRWSHCVGLQHVPSKSQYSMTCRPAALLLSLQLAIEIHAAQHHCLINIKDLCCRHTGRLQACTLRSRQFPLVWQAPWWAKLLVAAIAQQQRALMIGAVCLCIICRLATAPRTVAAAAGALVTGRHGGLLLSRLRPAVLAAGLVTRLCSRRRLDACVLVQVQQHQQRTRQKRAAAVSAKLHDCSSFHQSPLPHSSAAGRRVLAATGDRPALCVLGQCVRASSPPPSH